MSDRVLDRLTGEVGERESGRGDPEIAPVNRNEAVRLELDELERRLEMQRLPLGSALEGADGGCYSDACDQVCDVFCTEYTGCLQDCLCNLEDCFDKCGTDCLMLCYKECLGDCGFCAGDW
ncbi:MAG: hypothetical protein AB1640_04195 [bacterium]